MKPNFHDVLDSALERQLEGEPLATILPDFPEQADGLARLLSATAVLVSLPPVSLPDSVARHADRATFLAEATQQPVSPGPLARLTGWIVTTLPWFDHKTTDRQKEKHLMSSLILKAALALVVVLSVAGGTAVTATASLPDSPVYPIKLGLEDAQLALTTDRAAAVALHTDLAAERIREMEQLALAGHVPDTAVLNRLQFHLEAALNLASQLPEQTMAGSLQQIQTMIQTRTRTLEQVQAQTSAAPQAALTQAYTLLQDIGDVVTAGLQDPRLIRDRDTVNRPDHAPIQPEMTPRAGAPR